MINWDDPIEVNETARKLFPKIIFFPASDDKNNKFIENDFLHLYDFFVFIKKKAKAGLLTDEASLVYEMLKEPKYAPLFPMNAINSWDNLKNNIQNGEYDVIKFFINEIDSNFINGYNNAVQSVKKYKDISINNYSPVVTNFYNKFDARSYTFEEIKLAKQLDLCAHSPSDIYGVFEYCARRQYSLIRIAREFLIPELYNERKKELVLMEQEEETQEEKYRRFKNYYGSFSANHDDLYNYVKGITYYDDIEFATEIIFKELFIKKLKEDLFPKDAAGLASADLFNKIQYILEGKHEGFGVYDPIDFITLTKNAIREISPLRRQYFAFKKTGKNDNIDNDFLTFSYYELSKMDEYLEELKSINNRGFDFETELQKIEIGHISVFTEPSTKVEALNLLIRNKICRDVLGDAALETIKEFSQRLRSSKVSYDNEVDKRLIQKRTLGTYQMLLINDFREIFADNFLKKQFKKDNDEWFIKYIAKEAPVETIRNELGLFLLESYHNSDNLIAKEYLREGYSQNDYTVFARKMKKALEQYLEWYAKDLNRKKSNKEAEDGSTN